MAIVAAHALLTCLRKVPPSEISGRQKCHPAGGGLVRLRAPPGARSMPTGDQAAQGGSGVVAKSPGDCDVAVGTPLQNRAVGAGGAETDDAPVTAPEGGDEGIGRVVWVRRGGGGVRRRSPPSTGPSSCSSR